VRPRVAPRGSKRAALRTPGRCHTDPAVRDFCRIFDSMHVPVTT
jgi:hypothetical protein